MLPPENVISKPSRPTQTDAEGAVPLAGKAVRPVRLADQLYQRIYDGITGGQFPVHSKLPSEAEMCRSFGVSRPIVREALARLHVDGVIETQKGSGSFVRLRKDAELFALAPIGGLPELLRCMELRCAIEGDAAYLAASRRTKDDLREIRQRLEELSTAIENREVGHEVDFRFHRAVAVAAHNEMFVNSLTALSSQIFDFMRVMRSLALNSSQARMRLVQEEHEQIYQAILEENPDRARQAMRQHIENSKGRTLADTVSSSRLV